MRYPGPKTLEEAFPGKGLELRQLLLRTRKTGAYASVEALKRECYNPPDYHHRLLTAINEVLEGHGIEAICHPSNPRGPDAEYINMGDTYNTTIMFDYNANMVRVTTYGD